MAATANTSKKAAPKKATKSTASMRPARTQPSKAASKKPAKLAQAATAGTVKFYRQRRNGTFRRLPYLASGTPTRKQAEAVAQRRSKGETIPAIADDLNLSRSTVRRLETGLQLSQAVEAGQHDKAWDGMPGELVLETVVDK